MGGGQFCGNTPALRSGRTRKTQIAARRRAFGSDHAI